ncbi:uncharacterized protein YndB with AHSA1/START domain [Diaminobutyricimonas aerilata]|uniref:Uncharacterized protein YndB with AHSA1/START domain n=1 Tax=Diaminobutyricimonas aerilata TaxID=1162967 RepID=A0A2M9CGU9_9MICO|nr:SRPBCC family protein [Diaminobutyricimonas aerilata]PJJ71092.1 uncharacterized protein YndB with AHSA1/START domain [Diaminobutyricimonas aerilata]
MSTPRPTGTVGDGPRGREVRLTRRYRAAPEAVWAALTESDRLERWIGRWEGDPRTGRISFFMTAEGEDVEPEEYVIRECDPPRRFAADTAVGEQHWHLRFELEHSPEEGMTTLTFAQLLADDDMSNVGPGWEYYLDRLTAAIEGHDVDAIAFDDYYPALKEYYAALA